VPIVASQDPRRRAVLAVFAVYFACSLIAGAALLTTAIVASLDHFSIIGLDVREIVRPLLAIAIVAVFASLACSGAVGLVALAETPGDEPRRRYVGPAFRLCAGAGLLAWIALSLAL
jgi:hypothetical protein